MGKTIRQTVTLRASPHEVYEALMDSKKHAAFSHETARISRKVGGIFSAYGGYIRGRNLALTPDSKIVQAWRASDWEKGIESKVTIRLTKKGKGTSLQFVQENVPADDSAAIRQGWKDFYWEPMKEYFTRHDD